LLLANNPGGLCVKAVGLLETAYSKAYRLATLRRFPGESVWLVHRTDEM